jgi:formylglycine-generating enzyme required for sulfatase activity
LLVSLKKRTDSFGLQNASNESVDISDRMKIIEESNEHAPLFESISEPSQEQEDTIARLDALMVEQDSVFDKINKYPNKITLSNGMEFMHVSAGEFLMGSNNGEEENEKPQHAVDIPYDYWAARFPVTNELYSAYVRFIGVNYPVYNWEQKKDHPVVMVKWVDAVEYCNGLNDLFKAELPLGLDLRLPTEVEWEKSARGMDGREYPWGNFFDRNRCNTNEGSKGDTTPVGLYSSRGDSYYGCADMAGNVWEHSLRVNNRRGESVDEPVLRGGSFNANKWCARSAFCSAIGIFGGKDVGFRIYLAPHLPK